MKLHTSLVWFRRDLRAFDHAALHHALTSSKKVFCCFIFDNDILSSLPRQDRRVDFIHASVIELDAQLRALGGGLLVRHGKPVDLIPAMAAELDAGAVFTNRDYEPDAIGRDDAVAARLAEDGRALHCFKDQVIFDRDEVLTQSGSPFTVFTPYKKAWLKRLAAEPQALAPWPIDQHAAALAEPPAGKIPTLQDLRFEPAAMPVPPGAAGAAALFEDFLTRIADYRHARDFPAVKGPSYLSTHLRFGTTSIRYLVRTVQTMLANGAGGDGAATWLSELIWREFYAMILYQNPHVVGSAFKPAYDAIEWEQGAEAEALFAAWCEGRTGYPLVDAAMAQINQTGYMHNRLRMVAASFLVKDLGIDWRWGEQYFALLLNDFDLASNNGGWQWAASTGSDAQPYFRIFNPVTQSEKFDPEGEFIKRYLPQLAKLDRKTIHAPWLHGGVAGYPPPLVDHNEARRKTLARFAVVKQAPASP